MSPCSGSEGRSGLLASLASVPEHMGDLLHAERPISSWTMLFNQLNSQDLDQDQLNEVAQQTERGVTLAPVTPGRRARRSLLDGDAEEGSDDGSRIPRILSAGSEMSTMSDEGIAVVLAGWNKLVNTVGNLHREINARFGDEAVRSADEKATLALSEIGSLRGSLTAPAAGQIWPCVQIQAQQVIDLSTQMMKVEESLDSLARDVHSGDANGTVARGLESVASDVDSVTARLESWQAAISDLPSIKRKLALLELRGSRICVSFHACIPTAFGKPTALGKGSFDSMKTMRDWDAGDGRSGVVPAMKAVIHTVQTSVTSDIIYSLAGQGELMTLANAMCLQSVSFWNDLTVWVSQFHYRLTSRDTGTPLPQKEKEEAWKLILKVLEDIFTELQHQRVLGKGAERASNPTRRVALILYASLRAHKFMKELSVKEFERHP